MLIQDWHGPWTQLCRIGAPQRAVQLLALADRNSLIRHYDSMILLDWRHNAAPSRAHRYLHATQGIASGLCQPHMPLLRGMWEAVALIRQQRVFLGLDRGCALPRQADWDLPVHSCGSVEQPSAAVVSMLSDLWRYLRCCPDAWKPAQLPQLASLYKVVSIGDLTSTFHSALLLTAA